MGWKVIYVAEEIAPDDEKIGIESKNPPGFTRMFAPCGSSPPRQSNKGEDGPTRDDGNKDGAPASAHRANFFGALASKTSDAIVPSVLAMIS
mmetsp:Transcript_30530/g.48997  ORF Transcript_30530/g.48997 Transcript_30530/m.48997 type:complete len:92 (+) Transcript_30530:454-729(+)